MCEHRGPSFVVMESNIPPGRHISLDSPRLNFTPFVFRRATVQSLQTAFVGMEGGSNPFHAILRNGFPVTTPVWPRVLFHRCTCKCEKRFERSKERQNPSSCRRSLERTWARFLVQPCPERSSICGLRLCAEAAKYRSNQLRDSNTNIFQIVV